MACRKGTCGPRSSSQRRVEHAPRLVLLLLVLTAPVARSEETPATRVRHHFAGRIGLAVGQAREDLLVPLPQTGPGLSLGFLYRLEAEQWFLEGRVGAALLVGFDRYGTTNGVVEPAVQLSWLHDLPRPNWLTRVSVGPTLGAREFLGYYGSWDDSHLYWLGSTSLSASARAWVEVGGRDLEVGLSLPVVALVSRPPRYFMQKISPVTSPGYWLSRFADAPALTSWHQLQAFTLEVQWRARGDQWVVDPFVSVDFVSFAAPARATYLTYWVGLEVRR